ncbi:MAG: radical SAM protein [Synergistaceae bacterium]|nr:radical SAM protein [Synergistaceae bacterium]
MARLGAPRRAAYFIPFRGCARRCVYCDQRVITQDASGGAPVSPDVVRRELSGASGALELCFFGGSFAKLERGEMTELLRAVESAPNGSVVTFSSYPGDFEGTDGAALIDVLRGFPIGTIELGVPSLDPHVLARCGRQDDPGGIKRVLTLLRDEGFRLGVQTMIGLPGQTFESAMSDIEELGRVMAGGAWDLRLYPCLVLRGTELESMSRRGGYSPLGLEDAARQSGALLRAAEAMGFNVIRVGLQDSPTLKRSVVGGPYHPAFGELALSEKLALELFEKNPRGPWRVEPYKISQLKGHGARGARRLAELASIPFRAAEALIEAI